MAMSKYVVQVTLPQGSGHDYARALAELTLIGCRGTIVGDDGRTFSLQDATYYVESELSIETLIDVIIGLVRRVTLHLAPPEIALFRVEQGAWALRAFPKKKAREFPEWGT
ncbi:hypothetical protein ACI2VK_24475 [Ralstonia nicotianae]|uniref:hypothetical protein n=1 Tax=Ralstonia pseudosolanacearum TaxID=1310165 RepID=UPI001F3CD10A|nr:hypothetical protein [Ralstonia pseudosolanacearum]MCF1444511.1 hypothetical protein [Ralstonia solanacearum]MDO3524488.1 hypothetical protein [Ralstonia pseudosolanacearum]MDO3552388.1 hypothetical protein [Ralstonia pseudosolanacearum]MDO3591209.1 hypothetical protein [Ralstonia pseudosolanacearum]MDO3595699.1 hypothetical protein [Ralstonia pseudosolanacearum]